MKTIKLSPPFTMNGDHAYLYSLPCEDIIGDSPEFPKASYAYLLEDGQLLGPAHALHYIIRDNGRGAFSHWQDHLIFSSSDNSDPNTNGRTYELCIPSSKEMDNHKKILMDAAGSDPEFCYEVLRAAVNTNGSAFASYLTGYRSYQKLMATCGVDFKGKTILEIGSGPNPGTALAFLLGGAKKYYANDHGKIHPQFSNSYAKIIQFLTQLVASEEGLDLEKFLIPCKGENDLSEFNHNFYQAFSETPAETIDLPDNSLDLVLSVSVLEHVTKPSAVLENVHRMLKPGGVSLHIIDLRDHSNPTKPISFLKMSKEEYASIATENRWRASDFIEEFKKIGYDLESVLMTDRPVSITTDGNFDMMDHFMKVKSNEQYFREGFEQITPWVTEAIRKELHPDYHNNTLQDLSTTGLIVVAKKES